MTSPDWVSLMKKAAAIITDRGGRTCHAAIVSRELGIPALVGTTNATQVLRNNQKVTVDCHTGSLGTVYEGLLQYTTTPIKLNTLPQSPVPLMLNIGQPATAFACASLPVSGVGLARTEFIIANDIGIHPLALINYQKLPAAIKKQICIHTSAYSSPAQFFVHTMAQQIATIAAAFWPKPIFVRLSDFKSNEYRHLIGGELFEPMEDNPMLGMRGAARYINAPYRAAVKLECAAVRYARTVKGFSNIHVMVPFVRTIEEARAIKQLLKRERLSSRDHVQNIMMCETPANALLIKNFCQFFDGFSIGSNDLTQLTLGIDRDCEQLAGEFDEQNDAVKQLIHTAITGAHAAHKTIGICGQAPSDCHDFCLWLIKNKIDYVSLNADAIIPFLLRLK
jgi:pyruvate,water dikinase